MAKMRMFDAKYAAIDLTKDAKTISITWKAILNISQYKLVAELVMQLLRKHNVNIILEDQTYLQSPNKKEMQQYFVNTLIPRYNTMEVKKYFIKGVENVSQGFNIAELKSATQRLVIEIEEIAQEENLFLV